MHIETFCQIRQTGKEILFFNLFESLSENAADVAYGHKSSVVDFLDDPQNLTGFLLAGDDCNDFTFRVSVPAFAVDGGNPAVGFLRYGVGDLGVFPREDHNLDALLVAVEEQVEGITEDS